MPTRLRENFVSSFRSTSHQMSNCNLPVSLHTQSAVSWKGFVCRFWYYIFVFPDKMSMPVHRLTHRIRLLTPHATMFIFTQPSPNRWYYISWKFQDLGYLFPGIPTYHLESFRYYPPNVRVKWLEDRYSVHICPEAVFSLPISFLEIALSQRAYDCLPSNWPRLRELRGF